MQLVCSRQISPHRSILSTPANISMRSEMSQATPWLLQLTGLPARVSLGRICARRKSREEYVWTLILTKQEWTKNNLHKVYLSLGCQRKGILIDLYEKNSFTAIVFQVTTLYYFFFVTCKLRQFFNFFKHE